MKGRTAFAALLLAAGLAAGCTALAIWTAPEKTASAARTEAAERADALFWTTLHAGDYEGIPRAITALTAAYLADPLDPVTAAHLGWLHIWRLVERARLDVAAADDLRAGHGPPPTRRPPPPARCPR